MHRLYRFSGIAVASIFGATVAAQSWVPTNGYTHRFRWGGGLGGYSRRVGLERF